MARPYLVSHDRYAPVVLDLPLAWWAPLGFLVYAAISLRVGSLFPFSKYSMYASSPNRRQGAVPVLLCDGEPVSWSAYERISGLRSRDMYPPGLPCSLEWMVLEAKRWVDDHPAVAGEPPGPVQLTWGFRMLTLGDDHELREDLRVIGKAQAWLRS
jgi:hypothetical protein